MFEPRNPSERATEDVVRRYIGRMVLRYLPFTLALAIFVAMVIIVPTRSPSDSKVASAGGAQDAAGSVASGGNGVQDAGGSAATGTAGGGGNNSSGRPIAAGVTAGGGGGPVEVAPMIGGAGVTASGASCGPGVRQVSWSKYSTLCVPKFHGNNGGATAFGVTGSSITATFRISDSGEAGAIAAAAPSLNQQAQDQYFQDLVTYVNYFNSQFELYGRRVVVREFTGQGDWVQEYQGQDPQGAEADAATARHMGAFIDISSTAVSTTPLYAQYLASDHVISAGGVAGSDHYFQTNSPYIFSVGASISRLIDFVPNVVCQRMKSLPAIFSGDPASTHLTRKFGLIYPTNPDFQMVGDAVKRALVACGASPAVTYEYALDLSTMASDSTNAMAQMRSKGVTTVICLCDTVVPRFLTNAASGQDYHPEWFDSGAADSLAQAYDQSEWAHAIEPGSTAVPPTKSEAYAVFLRASSGKQPVSTYYTVAYATAILMFDALQNAGPALTPASFQQGFFGLASSLPGGQMGQWVFGQDHWTPQNASPIAWYSPTAISGQDNMAGALQSCGGADGQDHPWEPRSAYGAAGTQLHCFGQ